MGGTGSGSLWIKQISDGRLERAAEQRGRPRELGKLEITVTTGDPFDQRSVEAFAPVGVHWLVVLPNHETSHAERHNPGGPGTGSGD